MELEGKTYLLNRLSLEISQAVDSVGRPSSSTKGGKIRLEMDSVDDDTITDWMVNAHKKLNGKVVFYKIDEASKLKELKFEDAYCVEMLEKFDGTSSSEGMTMQLTISAEKLSIGSVEISNDWPK